MTVGTPWRMVQSGTCPVCGRDVCLRPKDGAVMRHHDARTGRPCRAWIENQRPEGMRTG